MCSFQVFEFYCFKLNFQFQFQFPFPKKCSFVSIFDFRFLKIKNFQFPKNLSTSSCVFPSYQAKGLKMAQMVFDIKQLSLQLNLCWLNFKFRKSWIVDFSILSTHLESELAIQDSHFHPHINSLSWSKMSQIRACPRAT